MKKLVFSIFALIVVYSQAVYGQAHQSMHQLTNEKYKSLDFETEAEWDDYNNYTPNAQNKTKQKKRNTLNKVVYGWVPYWAGSAYNDFDYSALTDVAYFSYEVNPSTGGYDNLHSWSTTSLVETAQSQGCRVHLTATCFGNTNNRTLLTNATARQNLIDNLIAQVKSRNADGVNIDFEAVPSDVSSELTDFMNDLGNAFHTEIPGSTVSIALPAVDWSNVFDVAAMTEVDLFLIMGYDYHWKGGEPGPVAPLHNGTLWSGRNITRSIIYYLEDGIPNQKLALGVPYYGIQWPVTDNSIPGTKTANGSSVVYYSAVENARTYGRKWDEHSLTPYYTYESNGNWFQTWYDDEVSLAEKYDIVNAFDIAGIGIWALSYTAGWTIFDDIIKDRFSDTKNTRSGLFTDIGGAFENYADNMDYTVTLDPPGQTQVKAVFSSFDIESNNDYLYVYDGSSTSATLIGTYTGTNSPGTVVSNNGALTFRFTSDNATNKSGWVANWNAVYTESSGSVADLWGETKNYANNEKDIITIAPEGASTLSVTFDVFETEKGYDFLNIYDGDNINASLIGSYHGNQNISGSVIPAQTIVARGNSLTFEFESDYYTTKKGWKANWTSDVTGNVSTEPQEHIVLIDDFETRTGHFDKQPTFSGSTKGVDNESSQSQTTSIAKNGSGSLEVVLKDDVASTDNWFVRLLSGGGNPQNNTQIDTENNIGFWLKTSTAPTDAKVCLWIDDSDGLEQSAWQSIQNDGEWHYYEFSLTNYGGTTITTGNGEIDATQITIDAIVVSAGASNNNWTFYVDDVMEKENVSTPVAPIAQFVAAVTDVCMGTTISFTNQSTNANAYTWQFAGGNPQTSTDKNPQITYSAPGVYNVSLTATGEGGSSTETKSNYIKVAQLPEAGFTASNATIDENQSIVFTNTSTNAQTYLWDFDGGSPASSTSENVTVTYPAKGTYTVTLTVKDVCNNQDQHTATITVNEVVSSVADIQSQKDISISPNPANGFISVDLINNSNANHRLYLYNMQGKQMLSEKMNGSTHQLNLAGLASGIYILRISGYTETYKIVIQ